MSKEFCVVATIIEEGDEVSVGMHIRTNNAKNAVSLFKQDICQLRCLYEDELKDIRVMRVR